MAGFGGPAVVGLVEVVVRLRLGASRRPAARRLVIRSYLVLELVLDEPEIDERVPDYSHAGNVSLGETRATIVPESGKISKG
jgi:hypothetical protein